MCFFHSDCHSLVQATIISAWDHCNTQWACNPNLSLLAVCIAIRKIFQKMWILSSFVCLKFPRGPPGLLECNTKSVPRTAVLLPTYCRLTPCSSPPSACLFQPSRKSFSFLTPLGSLLLCAYSHVLLFSPTLPPSPLLGLCFFISNKSFCLDISSSKNSYPISQVWVQNTSCVLSELLASPATPLSLHCNHLSLCLHVWGDQRYVYLIHFVNASHNA